MGRSGVTCWPGRTLSRRDLKPREMGISSMLTLRLPSQDREHARSDTGLRDERVFEQLIRQSGHAATDLDQPTFNRKRLKVEKLIDSKVLEQLIRVQVDAGCSRRSSGGPPVATPAPALRGR